MQGCKSRRSIPLLRLRKLGREIQCRAHAPLLLQPDVHHGKPLIVLAHQAQRVRLGVPVLIGQFNAQANFVSFLLL